MLRGVVLLLLLVNLAVFLWLRAEPGWGQSDREPDRLRHQVAPESVEVLPDLPVRAAAAAASPASGAAPAPVEPVALPEAAPQAVVVTPAHPGSGPRHGAPIGSAASAAPARRPSAS